MSTICPLIVPSARGRRGLGKLLYLAVKSGIACRETAPVVSGDVIGDTIRKAVNLDAVCQSDTFRCGIVLNREHCTCANITHAKDGALGSISAHILESIPGNGDLSVPRSLRQIIHHRVDRMPDQAGEGAVRNGDIRHPVSKHCGKAIREFAFFNNKVVCLGYISVYIQADAICFTGVVRNAELAVVKLNIVDERVLIAIGFYIHAAREGQTLKGNVAPSLTDPVTNVMVLCSTHDSVRDQISAELLGPVALSAASTKTGRVKR